MMKKDRECLQSVIQRRIDKLPRAYSGPYSEGSRDAYHLVLQDIDQLDEPEVLSQEWISDHIIFNEKEDAEYIYADELQNLLVPKQELPVVPKHVGEWITRYREKYDLYPALRMLENNTFVWGEIYEWYRMNTHKFVNAFLTGEYEVEEEPLYYALIKGHELIADEGDWTCKYWKFDTSNGRVFPGHRLINHSDFLTEMTKEDWNEFGINDSNADFVRVEEMEE